MRFQLTDHEWVAIKLGLRTTCNAVGAETSKFSHGGRRKSNVCVRISLPPRPPRDFSVRKKVVSGTSVYGNRVIRILSQVTYYGSR